MALGARGRDVRSQFLVGALLLGCIGGLVGLCLGIFGSRALTQSLGWPMQVSTKAVLIAVGFAAGVGIILVTIRHVALRRSIPSTH